VASFDRAVEVANISAAGRKVEIKQIVEAIASAYLSISGTLDRSLLKLMSCLWCRGGLSIALRSRILLRAMGVLRGLGIDQRYQWAVTLESPILVEVNHRPLVSRQTVEMHRVAWDSGERSALVEIERVPRLLIPSSMMGLSVGGKIYCACWRSGKLRFGDRFPVLVGNGENETSPTPSFRERDRKFC
jgi:hypothetical protein